jgi:hypothetical protein
MWFEDITKLHHNTELTESPTQIRQRENVQKSHLKFKNEKVPNMRWLSQNTMKKLID